MSKLLTNIRNLSIEKKVLIIIILILAIVIATLLLIKNSSKTEEVIQMEEMPDIKVANVTDENIEFEYNSEPTTEAVNLVIKSYDDNYNLYYYIQEVEQALQEDEILEENSEEKVQESTTEEVIVEEETQENIEELQESEILEIAESEYMLYEGETLSIQTNSVVYFKYENSGVFSEDAYKLEITNIVDTTDIIDEEETTEGETTEGATEEELEEALIDTSDTSNNTATYYIKVNYTANVVTIYKKDSNNEYTIPVKAMVCSTGTATPTSGVYKTTNKYVWRLLYGGVYGQYATRIVGSILFHSVPYYTPNNDALDYTEYDKLGTSASAGCIRLTVADAKWIYDNCSSGTMVEFYSSSEPGPLGKPTAMKISSVVECRNYDPTDPIAGNPWATYTGSSTSTDSETTSTSTSTSSSTSTSTSTSTTNSNSNSSSSSSSTSNTTQTPSTSNTINTSNTTGSSTTTGDNPNKDTNNNDNENPEEDDEKIESDNTTIDNENVINEEIINNESGE